MAESFEDVMKQECQKQLNIIDNLRKLDIKINGQAFSLPKIAVVGNQSAGKSSLLRCCCGFDLPRDKGLTTRCPLQLSIRKALHFSAKIEYKTKEGSDVNITIKNKTEIAQYILDAQVAITGNKTTISESLISLTVNDPDISVDLTLMDLPGLTQKASNEQDKNTPELIRKLVESQIKDEATIILLVLSGQDNNENSAGFTVAEKYDKEHKRTIGVITKIDIVEEHMLDIVANNLSGNGAIELKRGYNAVICHSYNDIQENKSDAEVREKESRYFESKPEFKNVQDKCGILNLLKKLSKLLIERIEETMPTLKARIEDALLDQLCKRDKLPEYFEEDEASRNKVIHKFIIKIADKLKTLESTSLQYGKETLSVASQIQKRCQDFQKHTKDTILKLSDVEPEEYESLLTRYTGFSLPNMLTMPMIQSFISKAVKIFTTESNNLIDCFVQDLVAFINVSIQDVFPPCKSTFKLKELFEQNLKLFTKTSQKSAKSMIQVNLQAEQYKSFGGECYLNALSSLEQQWQEANNQEEGKKEMTNAERLKLSVEAYLTEMVNVYPKIIVGLVMHNFIYGMENDVREIVILGKDGNQMSQKELNTLITNDPAMEIARQNLEEQIQKLRQALEIISQL
ncbi:Dynamin [Hexamita inflata]|uniref:dynamin GTPase n=1 Tax=Hexamita inflata TaxID=28002 RepID=A0AA86PZ90_9EUKA|nr:Dynamin [Hexamita inflata]